LSVPGESGDRGQLARNAPGGVAADEEDRSHHQAIQARRGDGGASGGRRAGAFGHRGQGLRTPEGPYRTLPRRRICRRLPAQGEDRGRAVRRHGRGRDRGHRLGRPHRQDRRRQDLRLPRRTGHPHPHRRNRRGRDLKRPGGPRPPARTSTRKDHRMSKIQDALKLMKDEEVEYVDIRFTDPKGKLQHVTLVADLVDEEFFEEGFMFDGSSIAGWKSIDQSDMKLMPDASSAYIDPFYAEKTLCVHCNVVEPDTGEPYARDPRGTALKAEAYLKSSGIGDISYFGPEAEFFLFDD